jgi:DNA primase
VSLIEGQDPESLLKQVPPYFGSIIVKSDIIIDEEEIAPMMGQTHKYALDRGLEIETIRTWGGGYDSYRKRILFPVRNTRGQLVGAVGRTINGHHIKYFNYFDFNKSRYLFGEHFVKGGSLIIVEGLLDTVSVWQALQKENALEEFSVVGLLGSSPSKKQLDKIKKLSRDVVLFLDNDAAGKCGTEDMKKALWKSVLLTAIEYPSEDISDPDDAVRKGISISQLARNAPIAVV